MSASKKEAGLMADVLILAENTSIESKGDIIEVRIDDQPRGRREVLPRFIYVHVSSFPLGVYKYLSDPAVDVQGDTIVRRRFTLSDSFVDSVIAKGGEDSITGGQFMAALADKRPV